MHARVVLGVGKGVLFREVSSVHEVCIVKNLPNFSVGSFYISCLADPYVKIYMIHEYKRMNKWKTEVKKNTLVPIYNELFQFDVSGMDVRSVSLEIWVMDYDWFSRNDKMGVVYVGGNSPQEVGRNHWLEIISSPEHQTSHWHTIIPYTDLKQMLPLAKQQQRLKQQQQQQVDYLRPPGADSQQLSLPGNSPRRGDAETRRPSPDTSTL